MGNELAVFIDLERSSCQQKINCSDNFDTSGLKELRVIGLREASTSRARLRTGLPGALPVSRNAPYRRVLARERPPDECPEAGSRN